MERFEIFFAQTYSYFCDTAILIFVIRQMYRCMGASASMSVWKVTWPPQTSNTLSSILFDQIYRSQNVFWSLLSNRIIGGLKILLRNWYWVVRVNFSFHIDILGDAPIRRYVRRMAKIRITQIVPYLSQNVR